MEPKRGFLFCSSTPPLRSSHAGSVQLTPGKCSDHLRKTYVKVYVAFT